MTHLPLLLSISSGDWISIFIAANVAIVVFLILFLIFSSKKVVVSHWHHPYDNFGYSSKELYKTIEKWISDREIPGVSMTHVTRVESSFLGTRREYLRIEREEYRFDICAAPFGTGFFVSWWLIKKISFFKRMLAKIPSLAPLSEMKTFYQQDTEAMFKEYVHLAVTKALDEMTGTKGFRLSETERRFTDFKK